MRFVRWLSIGVMAVSLGLAPRLTHPSTVQAGGMLTVGTNVNITRMSNNQSEPAIAMNPTNPNNIVEVSNGPGRGQLVEGRSTDGGATWTTKIIANGDNLGTACCDPSLSFDNFGNLFLVYLDNATTTVETAISTDGGQTFAFLSPVGVAGSDQPTITSGANSVWVTYRASDGNIAAAGATDTGLGVVGMFGPPEEAPGSATGNFGGVAIGPNGQVMVTYQSPSGGAGPSTIFVNLDPDGLGPQGFGNAINVTATNVGGFYPIPAQLNRTIDAEAELAWDRSGGQHNGRVFMVYTNAPVVGSANTDNYVIYSDNNGTNWSKPVRVNDDTTQNSQFLPYIAVDQTTGNVAVSWYDSRNDTGNGGAGDTNGVPNDDAQFFASASTDGGATFLPNVQVSAGTSNSADAANGIDYGDYTGLTFNGGVFYPAWADNSNSTGDNPDGKLHQLDIYTVKVTLTNDTTPPTCALLGVSNGTISVNVQDSDGGLQGPPTGIVVSTINATSSIAPYSAGTTTPVLVQATKQQSGVSSSLFITATDQAGNQKTCDPVMTNAIRQAGKPETMSVSGVGKADHMVHVQNDKVGVENMTVSVNGQEFALHGMKDGQSASLDIASALKDGANSVTITTTGKPGGSAGLLFADM